MRKFDKFMLHAIIISVVAFGLTRWYSVQNYDIMMNTFKIRTNWEELR